MCEACDLTDSDPEIRKKAQISLINKAEQVRALANKLSDLAYGGMKPHSEQAKLLAINAKHVIRQLVEDWL